jgi:hypothetical protein
MGKVITHRFVESVQPKLARTEYPDAGCPGLYLIVQPSGSRSWAFRFRYNGVNGKKTLGRAGDGGLSLAAARAAAAAHRHRLDQGAAVTAVTSVTPKAVEGEDRIETAIVSFLERHAYVKTRRSTAWAAERIFNREVLPRWRGRRLDDIRKADVIELVEDIAASGRGYLANRTLGVLSKFFNWLVARDVLAISPVTRVENRAACAVARLRGRRAVWSGAASAHAHWCAPGRNQPDAMVRARGGAPVMGVARRALQEPAQARDSAEPPDLGIDPGAAALC